MSKIIKYILEIETEDFTEVKRLYRQSLEKGMHSKIKIKDLVLADSALLSEVKK